MQVDETFGIAASNLVFCAVGGALVFGTAVSLLRKVRPCQLLTRLWDVTEAVLGAFKWQHETDDSEIGAIVKEKMRRLKLENFRMFCQAFWCVGSAMTLVLMVVILQGHMPWSSWPKTLLQLVMLAGLSVITAFPTTLSWRTLDWFCALFMLCGTLYVSPWVFGVSEVHALFYVMWVDFVVLVLNLLRGFSRPTMILNLLYVLMSSATVLDNTETLPVRAELILIVQGLFLTLIPLCSYLVEVRMAATIRRSMDWEAAKEMFAAATALLRSSCDVVVELDADGVIACPAEDLRGFLLRGEGCRLQSTRLVDLFSTEEDKALLLKKLSMPRPSGISVAEAIHVHMRDGNNKLLKVEILSFEFRHLNGTRRHMTGLREFSDPPCAADGRWRLDEQPAAPDPPNSTEPDVSSVSESEDMAKSGNISPFDVREAVAIVDTTDQRLPIRGWSSGFQMQIGRLAPGTCLQDLLVPQHREHFADWMHMAAEYGSDWPNSRVVLSLRRGQVKVSCRVAQESGVEDVDRARVHVLFQNVRRIRSSFSDGCGSGRPHANFRGTPVLLMAL